MTLVESREEALWGLRWMQDAVQNSGKTKPGFYSVIGLLGAAGKLGKRSFVNNAACWSTAALVKMPKKKLFTHLKYNNQNNIHLQSTCAVICRAFKHAITSNTLKFSEEKS